MSFSDWKKLLCLALLFLGLSSCQKQKKASKPVTEPPKFVQSKTAKLSVELSLLDAVSFPNRRKGDRDALFAKFGMKPQEYIDSLVYFRKSPQDAKDFEESRVWLLAQMHPDSLTKKAKK